MPMAIKGAVILILYLIVIVFVIWCIMSAESDRRAEYDPDLYVSDDFYTIDEIDIIEEDIDGK